MTRGRRDAGKRLADGRVMVMRAWFTAMSNAVKPGRSLTYPEFDLSGAVLKANDLIAKLLGFGAIVGDVDYGHRA